MIEFVAEEAELSLRDHTFSDIIQKVIVKSNKSEVPKKDVANIYRELPQVNVQCVKDFLVHNFFFTDNTRTKYDFSKLVIFNLLYSGGDDTDKANYLFRMLENTKNNLVQNHDQKLATSIEYLTVIPCIVVGETLLSQRRFKDNEDDEAEFQELLSLYTTNSNMLREFANQLIGTCLFPSSSEKTSLTRADFLTRL